MFIELLLCPRHLFSCFTFINSYNLCEIVGLIIFPTLQIRKQDPEMLSNWFKVTNPSGPACFGIKTRLSGLWQALLPPGFGGVQAEELSNL